MSTERKRSTEVDFTHISEDDAARYLRAHADFFERHPELLARLKLPHRSGDNTVSLIERQVAILRERNRKLDQKLRELIGVARANDVLSGKIHSLAMRMIGTVDLQEMLQTIAAVLHDELGSDRSVLVLFGSEPESADLFSASFVRPMTRDEAGLELFRTFLNTSRPRCGQISGIKRAFLFGEEGGDIESAALIPLGDKAEMGFLAIGSVEASRFHPGMSTDFLVRLGELVERGLGCAS
jgi:uncharacterized protein YigA (DUF484 family)